MSITSDEVNYLVYRYLQESGFTHAAFTFSYESHVLKTSIEAASVPSGALITYLQKGLQCIEIETHLQPDGTELHCDAPFSLTVPHECHIVERGINDPEHMEEEDGGNVMDVSEDSDAELMIPEDRVTVLSGHSNEVYVCSWNPAQPLLASGSSDCTARIWPFPPTSGDAIVLRHTDGAEAADDGKNRGVTILDWSSDGAFLATGSYEGHAHIWTSRGSLKFSLREHKGPVFALRWNRRGDMLLSGSADKTAIVWDTNSGEIKQKFALHSAPTLDVDWRDDETFASCSTDQTIYVCRVGSDTPVRRFAGHQNEVNAVRWDPSGRFLASCSDDLTVKVWTIDRDTPLHNLEGHTRDIFTIRWSPTGPSSANPGLPLYLASASLDASIRVWNVESGTCLYTLTKYSDPVYSVSFSPNGLFLASGSCGTSNTSIDRGELVVWTLADGALAKTYKGMGGIFEVCWNPQGDKVAACFSNSVLAVIDVQ